MSGRAVTSVELWAEALVNPCENTNYRSWCGLSTFIRPRVLDTELSDERGPEMVI